MRKYILKGTLPFEGKGKRFAAVHVENAVKVNDDSEILNDTEIVVYAYLLVAYYDVKQRRVIFTDTTQRLALLINIRRESVTKALGSLIAKGFLKETESGALLVPKPVKRNYIIISEAFLLAPVLTTKQKAFLLRIAALQRAGILKREDNASPEDDEQSIDSTTLRKKLDMSRQTLNNTIVALSQSVDAEWLTVTNDTIYIDYTHLTNIVNKFFEDYYKESIQPGSTMTKDQLEEYGLTSLRGVSKRKLDIISRIEHIRNSNVGEYLPELLKAAKYAKESRLKLAQKWLERAEQLL